MRRSICSGVVAILVGGCQAAPRAPAASVVARSAPPQVTDAAAPAPASKEVRYLDWLQKTEHGRVEMTRRMQLHGIWFEREAAALPFQKRMTVKPTGSRPSRPDAADAYIHLQYQEAHAFFAGLERSRPPVPPSCAVLDRHYSTAMARASRAEEHAITAFEAHVQMDTATIKAQNAEIRSNLQQAERDLQSLCRGLKITQPFHISPE